MTPEQRQCTSKRVFRSRAEAKRYARVHNQHIAGHAKNAYQCWRCGQWHLTTRPNEPKSER